MNELTTWDYAASVERVRPKVLKLHDLTLDIYHELWEARDALSAQGARSDLTSGQMSRSWEGYCADVGLVKRTVNRWLTRYDPEERKLIEAPATPEEEETDTTSSISFEEMPKEDLLTYMRGITASLKDELEKNPATVEVPKSDRMRALYHRWGELCCDAEAEELSELVTADLRLESEIMKAWMYRDCPEDFLRWQYKQAKSRLDEYEELFGELGWREVKQRERMWGDQ